MDPRKYPDQQFSLYSIPAYDLNKVEILRGSEIGSSKNIKKWRYIAFNNYTTHQKSLDN